MEKGFRKDKNLKETIPMDSQIGRASKANRGRELSRGVIATIVLFKKPGGGLNCSDTEVTFALAGF